MKKDTGMLGKTYGSGVQALMKMIGAWEDDTEGAKCQHYETTLFTTIQFQGESHKSYVARIELASAELGTVSVANVMTYVMLRHSLLAA